MRLISDLVIIGATLIYTLSPCTIEPIKASLQGRNKPPAFNVPSERFLRSAIVTTIAPHRFFISGRIRDGA
ncbi:MAG: hypothetical protein JW837_08055 [Sedimentisphaerales bacterium]|nr:hypothetical protein [Sedimentisphaerales bacterium]